MANEWSAIAEVVGERIDRLVLTPAQSLHTAVARRVFDSVPLASAPARVLHDAVTAAAYSTVRGAVAASVALTASVMRVTVDEADSRPLSGRRGGSLTLSALNGLMGDRLEELGSGLSLPMSVRTGRADVACEPDPLRTAFPAATSRLAVFLHGLAENEEWWEGRRGPSRGTLSFGDRLRRDLRLTPLYVRYNSGLHISENGRRLSDLLESLIAAWPTTVSDLFLIGHSMGGLVARSARHATVSKRRHWPSLLRHIVTLGTPHHGAPLEKAVHATAWALRTAPESRPFAEILDARSAGIHDLRFGDLRDADWRNRDQRALFSDGRTSVPLAKGCEHTFITAAVTADPNHPVGRLVGDLVVRSESASGRCGTRSIPVPPGSVIHLGGLTHFDLGNHPVVYPPLHDALSRSLTARDA